MILPPLRLLSSHFEGGSSRAVEPPRKDSHPLVSGIVKNGAPLASNHQAEAERAAFTTRFGEWLSLVEHLLREQGVGGSNPLSPTILHFEPF